MKRAQPERQLQIAVFAFLDHALPEDAFRTAIPGGDRTVTLTPGYASGVPDILVIYEGRALLIELKSKAGRMSDTQAWCHVQLVHAGAKVHVARSIESVEGFLRACGVPLRVSVLKVAA